MIGQVIGNFRVVSVLGKGGMGEVFVAEHVGIQTRVAIKVLLPEISQHADHVHRLFNEARIVAKIKHAGIARIFDVGFHGGQAYLVMELLEGESLATRITRCGALPSHIVSDIGRQIGSVLAATHGAGITHRDLKPDNIFLVHDDELAGGERVKILDFGIAKLAGGSGPRTIGTMGTPEYMAPEQWGNSANVDWRADAYSLGCVLFEMATGRPPFPSHTIMEAFTQHTQVAPPSPRATAPHLPMATEQLILQLLAKDPCARGESMIHVVRQMGSDPISWTAPDVRELRSDPISRAPRAPTTLGGGAGEVTAPARARRRFLGAVATALVAVIAIATVALVRTGGVVEGSRAAAAPPTPPSESPATAAPPGAAQPTTAQPTAAPLSPAPSAAAAEPAATKSTAPTPAAPRPEAPASAAANAAAKTSRAPVPAVPEPGATRPPATKPRAPTSGAPKPATPPPAAAKPAATKPVAPTAPAADSELEGRT